ncbi:PaaI family thioesterase [Phaeobacter inhibens]|uniref:PaaI family thioesterase n=1 Tax=Phaeobacter inhibens TaxID=221822 RepID=UPI000274B685|nr:PaaI family thioesterase [Phaeobacter inhibens]AFO90888.1 thioesterase domain-containing protein [Phaeobacter inhibens DSM 17395]APX17752.1 thioesterase [Phaeobacter inhibens]AUQ45545.1 thioesterase -like protein [Phaeobacter inhibens]AUQ62125.1 thioesterase -like protein [Phaeobacter inhibens]AUQ82099.1 thioesterase -like protein [Phaeobacter inhibens]
MSSPISHAPTSSVRPRRAAGPQDLLRPEEITQISGLEFMQSILDGRLPGPPIGETLGYHLYSVEPGTVTFRGTPEFAVTNPMGTVHGGWYGTLLDSAMACAVMTRVPKGSVYTTLEFKVNILRSIPLGTEIECIGLTDHVGRSTGVAHGELRGVVDGRLYATGSTTCIVMQITTP